MRNAKLFHDGCGVCLGIAETFSGLFDPKTVDFEAIDLARNTARIPEAELAGVKFLPCVVIDGRVLPVEQHSDLEHLKSLRSRDARHTQA